MTPSSTHMPNYQHLPLTALCVCLQEIKSWFYCNLLKLQ